VKTLTKIEEITIGQAHENLNKIFRQTLQSFSTEERFEKDGRVHQNMLFKFPCACPMVISRIFGKSFRFPFPYF